MHKRTVDVISKQHTYSYELIDLGMHSFADTFIPADSLDMSEPELPLIVDFYPETSTFQLRYETDPLDRYNLFRYSYTSGNSESTRRHWDQFGNDLIVKYQLDKTSKILEIGSNDGYLLSYMMKFGINDVLGIDASDYMVNLSIGNNVPTIQGIFSSRWVPLLYPEHYDLIIANNVLNHSNDPRDFVETVDKLLKPEGIFVFQVPDFYTAFINGQVDQIYHEHVTYFTINYIQHLLKGTGLHLVDFQTTDFHGTSLICEVQKTPIQKVSYPVYTRRDQEMSSGMLVPSRFHEFVKKAETFKQNTVSKLDKYKQDGYLIAAIGASAKGNTILNYYGLKNIVDIVTDSSHLKIGKYTPKTRILIQDDSAIPATGKVVAFLSTWNLSDAFKKKLLSINPSIQFVTPFEKDDVV